MSLSTSPDWPETVDLLVVGSGVAGLSAAVTAAANDQRVLLVEKSPWLGGSSAWSGGTLWLPGCDLPGQPSGDSRPARQYLRHELGVAYAAHAPKVRAYLAGAQAAVRFFAGLERGALSLEVDRSTPDFHEAPGSSQGGRVVRARAFDGRRLGSRLPSMREPLAEFTLAGLGIEAGDELRHFQNAWRFWRHPRSTAHVTRQLAGGLWDRLRHGRSMRLVNGQALVAQLLAAADSQVRPVDIRAGVSMIRLRHGTRGAVLDAELRTPAGVRVVGVRAGVVLATGGFAGDEARLAASLPPLPPGRRVASAAPGDIHGDGARLAQAWTGRLERPDLGNPAPKQAPGIARIAGVPVSRYRRRSGAIVAFPHFVDRGKPGVIAVGRDGRRWAAESVCYPDFASEWLKAIGAGGPAELWLVADRCFLWRYGLGAVKPFWLLQPWALWTGYLKASMSIEGLATRCGIDPVALRQTIDGFNAGAPDDPEHRRGSSAFERFGGDPDVNPANPCVAPIARAPFYAVRLEPGCLATLAGIDTDRRGRVLDVQGHPVPGLYACGNDMGHPLGGAYPGNGVTLGAAFIFGHLASRAAMADAARATANRPGRPCALARTGTAHRPLG